MQLNGRREDRKCKTRPTARRGVAEDVVPAVCDVEAGCGDVSRQEQIVALLHVVDVLRYATPRAAVLSAIHVGRCRDTTGMLKHVLSVEASRKENPSVLPARTCEPASQ